MDHETAIMLVQREVKDAMKCHDRFNSAHEGLGVILEEFEELKAEVFKKAEARSLGNLRVEAIHLAATAIRFIRELT